MIKILKLYKKLNLFYFKNKLIENSLNIRIKITILLNYQLFIFIYQR